MDTNEGKLKFWVSNIQRYHSLWNVTLRVFATPAFSSARKSNFSLFILNVVPESSRLKYDILNTVDYARSTIVFEIDQERLLPVVRTSGTQYTF